MAELREIAKFTHRRIGWRDTPGGGAVSITAPLDKPYWRYYCACGSVGGKAATAQAARSQFNNHICQ